MNALRKFFGLETREEQVVTSDPYLAEFLGKRGVIGSVDRDAAARLAVAFACISTISQNLAAMPLRLYRLDDANGRNRAQEHPLYEVLQNGFNPQMTAFEGREFLIASILCTGNAYARLITDNSGRVIELYPLVPQNVAVEKLESGKLRYRITDHRGRVNVLLQGEVLHLRYRLGNDGILGQSPIDLARETFGTALTYQEQAAKQADKAFRAEGALSFPNPINSEKKDDALKKLGDRIESQAKTSGVLVLDGGADWKSFSLSPRDAEFLESRKLSNMDIARIFNVPPTVVGITDNATYSNVDGESKALVVRCLAPMAKRIEQSLNMALLTANERKSYFIEHDLAGLLRGDQKARYEAYRIGREWGWLSVNEIRGFENMREIEDGDVYISPLNMSPVNDGEGEE